MSVKFPSGLYKCATCQEVCAEPEAFEESKARRAHLEYVVGEAIELMKGYMDVKDGVCKWCQKKKSEHVGYPARSNYLQCRREVAPFVGCTFEAEESVPNDAMQAVLLLEEALKVGRKPAPHRFSNRKEVRQQFVPGLKLSEENGR